MRFDEGAEPFRVLCFLVPTSTPPVHEIMRDRAECSHGPIVGLVGESTSVPDFVTVSRNNCPLALMRKIGLAGDFVDGIE